MGSSARLTELPGWAAGLLAGSRVAHLGLLAEHDSPRVLPVTYAVSGETLVTAVDHKPKRLAGERLARVRWLRARPQAALTVDQYDDDWSRLAWIQAVGSVSVLAAADAPEAIAALVDRYEPYRSEPPAGPVLVLEPERLLWWRAA